MPFGFVPLRRWFLASVFGLSALIGMGRAASAQTAHGIGQVTTFGSGFVNPYSIAVDSSGNLYVADPGAGSVYLESYNSSTGAYTQSTLFSVANVYGVAVDSSGNVYLATGSVVYKETLSGGSYTQSAILTQPGSQAIAVDSSGNVYVTNISTNSLYKLAASGYAETTIDNGGLSHPYGVAVDFSGNLYVTNAAGTTVAKYTLSGTTYTKSTALSAITSGGGVALDTSGDIFVSNGSYVYEGALSGTIYTSSTFYVTGAIDLALDSTNNQYYVEPSSTGTKVTVAPNFGSVAVGTAATAIPVTFEVDTAGTLGTAIATTQGSQNQDFTVSSSTCTGAQTANATCTVTVAFTPTYPGQRLGSVSITNSSGAAIATVLVSGTGLGPLVSFPPGTASVVNVGSPGGTALGTVQGVALDAAGDVYISDETHNRIVKVTAGGVSSVVTVGTPGGVGLNQPYGVTLDAAGNLYITDSQNARVVKVTPAGVVSVVNVGTPGGVGMYLPQATTVDSAGNLYITDSGRSRVLKVTPTGAVNIVAIGTPGGVAISTTTGGVAVDSAGDLYLGDYGNNRVLKVTAAGVSSVVNFGTPGGKALSGPNDVKIDAAGDLYVADFGNNRIVEMSASGVSGVLSFGNPGGTALNGPAVLALQGVGNFYIADQNNYRVVSVNVATPPTVTFAHATPVGTTDTTDGAATITLDNIGNQPLIFSPPTTGGNPSISTGFTVSASSTCPQLTVNSNPASLAAGAGCADFVSFAPVVAGSISGSLVTTDNTLNVLGTTQTVTLNGTATPGTAVFGTMTFSPVSSVLETTSQAITISDTLTYGGVQPTGAVTFTLNGVIYTPTCTPSTSPETCTFTVPATTIAALVPASYTVTASLAADTNYASATGAGTFTVTPEPTNYSAPTTAVGSTSAIQTAYVTFTTAGTLGAISVVTTGIASLDYNPASPQGGNCAVGTTYSVGQTCTVQYTFSPLAPGLREGAIVLTTTGSTAVLGTTYLQGDGTGPLVTIAPGTMTTIAGGGASPSTCSGHTDTIGDGCVGTNAGLYNPRNGGVDAAGNFYFADESNQRVRKVSAATGVITNVAGTATYGFSGDGGLATSAVLYNPLGVAVDGAGNVYIADYSNNRIRKVTAATGIISTVVGGGAAPSTCAGSTNAIGDGCLATSAIIGEPQDVKVDGAGNLYIADSYYNRIREVSAATGIITTIAGSGSTGAITCTGEATGDNVGNGCLATSASINGPNAVALDPAGNVYFTDYYHQQVRKVNAVGGVITAASTVTLVAGSPTEGYGYNGDGIAAAGAQLYNAVGIAADAAGNVYIADWYDQRVRKVTAATGLISTVAGNGSTTTSCTAATGLLDAYSDGCAATLASFNGPIGVAVDSAGNLFVTDYSNARIRKITATAATLYYATTVAGSTSAQQVDTLSNIGYITPLTEASLTTGDTNANFSGAGTTCSTSSAVAVGASCNLGVVFAPTSVGNPLTGDGVVTDNSLNVAGATQLVPVSGVSTQAVATIGTMSFSPAATEPQGTSVAVTISDTVTYSGGQPTGALTFVLNGVSYTATCTTAGSPETCSATVPAATIAVLPGNIYPVTVALATDTYYAATTGTSGSFSITVPATYTAPTTAVGSTSTTQTGYVTITTASGAAGTPYVVTQGATGLDFNMVAGGSCATETSFTVGLVCSVEYTFSPLAPGPRQGAIVIMDSTGKIVLGTTYLSGFGTGPLAVLSPGTITTVAGNGTAGSTGDGGAATSAELYSPTVGFVDAAGNIYISDYNNARIRKVAAGTGIITTVAGGGTSPSTCAGSTNSIGDGCAATQAIFNSPFRVSVDGAGNLYIPDFNYHRVRKVTAIAGQITPASIITTIAGTGTAGYNGDNILATSADLYYPEDAEIDGSGNIYITDTYNQRIRKISATTGIITTVAGNGTAGYSGNGAVLATNAEVYYPSAAVLDGSNNLYISDWEYGILRKVDATTGYITTIAGLGSSPSTCAGSTDSLGDGCLATQAVLTQTERSAVDAAGDIFIADAANNRVRKITASTGIITTVVGNGTGTGTCTTATDTVGDNCAAPNAGMDYVFGVVLDGAGNMYIADEQHERIRKVTASAAPLVYPSTMVGASSAQQIVTLSNEGYVSPLTESSLTAGAVYTNFSGAATTCSTSSTLADGASCNLGVVFVPTVIGNPLTGQGVVTDNSLNVAGSTQVIPISGISTGLTATFGTMSFSPAASEQATTSQAITITDTLAFTNAAYIPAGVVAFTLNGVAYTATCTGTATPLTCTATVPAASIAALSVGVYTVTVAYATDNVYLATTGTSGTFTITAPPSTYTAPTTPVGSASPTQTADVTITTAGTLGAINVVTQGITGLDYNVVTGGTCAVGTTYTVGQVCTVEYSFSPLAPGLRDGAIVLMNTAGTGVLGTSFLEGFGTGPLVTIAPGTITTVAGNGGNATDTCTGYTDTVGDGCAATSATVYGSAGEAVDVAGNIYIADEDHYRVRKVTASTGKISTVAGTGTAGYTGDGTAATSAEINGPTSVAVDGAGNLYIADYYNNRIRKVTAATGIISTVAGTGTNTAVTCTGHTNTVGDGCVATGAVIYEPEGVAVDGMGNLYVADTGDARIREVSAATGIISTVAGTGTAGYNNDNITAITSEVNQPSTIAFDGPGNLYIADYANQRVREVAAVAGVITPASVITTIAGTGTAGYTGDGSAATSAELHNPYGVAADAAGNVYITDVNNIRIRKVAQASGMITTIAGTGTNGGANCNGYTDTVGDGCAATSAYLDNPNGIALDSAGNLYISDDYNERIRKVSATAATLYFASTVVGTTSAQQQDTLSNIGYVTALTTTSLTAGETNANFSGTDTTCSTSLTLATGASCYLGVEFAPATVASPLTGDGVVTDNSLNVSGATQLVPVSGISTLATPVFGTMTFSPAATEQQGSVLAVTISDTLTYGGVQPTGAVKFVLNGVSYTATCTTAGSPETCSVTVPAATIAALAVNTYTVTVSSAADSTYNAATGTSGTFTITASTFASLSISGFDATYYAPNTAIITEPNTVTVTALNTNGLPTATFTGTVVLTSSDSKASLPSSYTFTAADLGTHTFNLTMGTLGTQTVTAASGSASTQMTVPVGDATWLVSTDGRLTKFDRSGNTIATSIGSSGTQVTAGGAAFDSAGHVWSVNSGTNYLLSATKYGASVSTYTGGSLSAPVAVAVDGQGYIWIANSGSSTLSEFTNAGAAVTTTAGIGSSYTTGGTLSTPSSIGIDRTGGVWVANKGNSSLTHIVGIAAPVTTPLANGTTNSTLGTEP